jgi:hypothetical protein
VNRTRIILYTGAALTASSSIGAAVRHGDTFSITACAISTGFMAACLAVYEIRTRRG